MSDSSLTLMSRYWINAPSTLDSCHNWHGQVVIAPRELPKPMFGYTVTVYPVKGDTISLTIHAQYLSKFYGTIY